ncbi:MAG: hypothetical protein Q4A55_03460 [Aerococcus sp.]|nr:hypothetical protein [Aerococcus sp.]
MKAVIYLDNEPHIIIPFNHIHELQELMNNDLLNKTEVAEQILHVDTRTANDNWLYKPGFPYIQVYDRRYYPRQSVNQYLDQLSRKH